VSPEWLAALPRSGVRRLYLHVEGPPPAPLLPAVAQASAAGLLLQLQDAHPPPRFALRRRRAGRGVPPWAGRLEVGGRCLSHALLEGACGLLHLAPGMLPAGLGAPGSLAAALGGHVCRAGPLAGAPDQPALAPWLLDVPAAHRALAARGPHAIVPALDGVADRSACTKCRGLAPGLGLQDRWTPETDPCVTYYASAHAAARGRSGCVVQLCDQSLAAVLEPQAWE